MHEFAAAVTCIDGRYHEPLVRWMRDRFEVRHVDLVTLPGASAALARGMGDLAAEVQNHLAPSLTVHRAAVVVIAAHEGCAGDPSDECVQLATLPEAVAVLSERIGTDRRILGVRLRADGGVTVAADTWATDPAFARPIVEAACA